MNPKFQKLGMHRGLPVTSQPVPERQNQKRFPTTGSEILYIGATNSFGLNTFEGSVEQVGYGLEILGGVEGLSMSPGGSGPQTNTVSVTFLVGGETETGELRVARTFQQGEIFDGAILPGRYERIRVRWTSSDSTQPATPLKVRVFHQPLRVVPVMPPKPLGSPVLDYFDGLVFQRATQGSATVIYDDSVATPQPLLYRDANPAIGTGLGGDFRHGPHFSGKRRMFGRIVFPELIAASQNWAVVEGQDSAGTWQVLASFAAVERANSASAAFGTDAYQVIAFTQVNGTSDAGAGDIGSGMIVPGKIRIRCAGVGGTPGALAGCSVWLSFFGV